MEFLDRLQDLLLNHWDKLLVYFSMIPAGCLVWKVGNIFVKLVQNWTAKKYTKKQKEYTERITAEISDMKEFVKETIHEEIKGYVGVVKDTFNELQEKTQENKQKIYEKIFDKKFEVKEIVQDIKEDIEAEIDTITEEIPKVEEVSEPEVIEPEKKKVDLL